MWLPVDRVLPLEQPIPWEEYQLTLYALPGHTRYAAAIAFTADGLRFLATGDQYQGLEGHRWNYVYQNGFGPGDLRAGSELYRRLAPDMILSGHCEPRAVQPSYLDRLRERDAALEELHAELLPEAGDHPQQGLSVHIYPYQATAADSSPLAFDVQIGNLAPQAVEMLAELVVPDGWTVAEAPRALTLPAHAIGTTCFHVTPPGGLSARRVRLAVDITVAGRRLGQQAEALVTLV